MAKPVQQQKRNVNPKVIAAVTLTVVLIATIVAGILGLTGMKLDNQGLYKLLAWIPNPSQQSTWRDALVPGADFGPTLEMTLAAAPVTEGEAVTGAQLNETLHILQQRFDYGGFSGFRVERLGENQVLVRLPLSGARDQVYEQIAKRGEVGFATPSGEVFLTADHIAQASYIEDINNGTYAISFKLDAEGKRIFAEKTTELIGQNMSLNVDGVQVANPGISQPLTEGQASLPGFSQEQALIYATLMQSGPLPVKLTLENQQEGAPLYGTDAQNTVIIVSAVIALLMALYFLVRYRLGGAVAVWLMVIQLIAIWFLAALTRAGFTLITLAAVCASFGLLVYALMILYNGTKTDLDRGRSIRQAVKESYTGIGRVPIDVLAGLLLFSIIMIIADKGQIGVFMRTFALGLLVDLVLATVGLRLLLGQTISLFGSRTSLYTSARKEVA
jgi:preprotein translocase subunit SecD